MDYVKAKGIKNGKTVTVTVYKAGEKYTYELSDYKYIDELEQVLDGDVIVGGTYFAPDGSLLKAYYAMDKFYDIIISIVYEGEMEEIPYEPGVIY